MKNATFAIAIAIIITCITGCATRPQVNTTPEVEVAQVEDVETEIVNVTVFADSLEEAEEQVASAGYSVVGQSHRATAWQNAIVVPAVTR
jgi:hypothetical protein